MKLETLATQASRLQRDFHFVSSISFRFVSFRSISFRKLQ